MYTLKEIIEAWQRCYGEDLKKEYPGFVKDLIRNEKRPEVYENKRSRKNYTHPEQARQNAWMGLQHTSARVQNRDQTQG